MTTEKKSEDFFATYCQKILSADVSLLVHRTPLDYLAAVSREWGCRVFSKREDKQPVFSFKIRGAAYKMHHILSAHTSGTLFVPSTGNHAISVCYCAQQTNFNVVVIMPTHTSKIKIRSVERWGGRVILDGRDCHQSSLIAKEMAEKEGGLFIHPYEDQDIIVGHGTLMREIVEQLSYEPIQAVFVPVGGGALLSSVAIYIKNFFPNTRVIGVQDRGADAMRRSLQAGKIIEHEPVHPFSEATATKRVGQEAFLICQRLVDEITVVNWEQTKRAISDFYNHSRVVLEPAGALSLAGARQWLLDHPLRAEDRVVTLACGANADLSQLSRLFFLGEKGLQTL